VECNEFDFCLVHQFDPYGFGFTGSADGLAIFRNLSGTARARRSFSRAAGGWLVVAALKTGGTGGNHTHRAAGAGQGGRDREGRRHDCGQRTPGRSIGLKS
jgi:hypothetical protein